MKDALRKQAAAAAHRTTATLSVSQIGELAKVVRRRQMELEALRVREADAQPRSFHFQQTERLLAEAVAARDAALQGTWPRRRSWHTGGPADEPKRSD